MTKYQVLAHGGVLWDLTHIKPKIFDTEAEAKNYGEYLMKGVSKTEKKFYKSWYKIKPISDDKAQLIKLTGVF